MKKMSNNKNEKKPALLSRRDALKIIGATGVTAIATQALTSGALSSESIEGLERESDHVSGEHEWHMAIDLNECIGCQYCVWGCQATNNVSDEMQWNIGFPERTESGIDFFMTRPCLHCQDAPCVKVCPVGATWVREDGIVDMDYDRCIGCRYCQVACPYDARRFNWDNIQETNDLQPTWGVAEVEPRPRGVPEKCTFCVHRIDRGLEHGLMPGVDRAATPACVNICPVGARVFGDIKDPESPISKYLAEHETFRLREDFGTEPKVHYVRPQQEEA
jgi:molybdopterin-containing oxidoreductase family iron-sulfur binding subunit